MARSKIDHKELQKRLKEDEMAVYLQELKENSQRLYEQYGKQILLGVCAIIVLVVGGYLWYAKSQADFQERQSLLGNANALMQQENYEQALAQLNELLDRYGESEIAASASMLKGEALTQLGRHNEALQAFQNAAPMLSGQEKIAAEIAVVQSLRNLGQSQQALQKVQNLLNTAQSDSMKNYLIYLQGSCHEDLEQPQQAIESYKQISPESTWYTQAQTRIQWLQAKPVPPIN